jgi:hypothetical protein
LTVGVRRKEHSKMLHDADVLSLLMSRRRDYSLPRTLDADVFEIELERIWYKSWLFAVPACELPMAGSYVTYLAGPGPSHG